jgi:hypothetical protein
VLILNHKKYIQRKIVQKNDKIDFHFAARID